VRISQAIYDGMIDHVREGGAEERCGIIASRDDVAVELYRMRNALDTPRYGYTIDAAELYKVVNEIEDGGLDIGVIYHSHPRSAPEPSQADINLAKSPDGRPLWPGTIYIIVGFAQTEPDVKAWHLGGDDVAEAELDVV
jgi:proteasome lid subunit RPN8/RPN11